MLLAAAAALLLALAAFATGPDPAPTPVLVELYTSEGCSSCPPADALVDELARLQPVEGVEVVALGFHVDYWNSLGWADPFSSADHSARQALANEALGRDGVFTPQVLVNGRRSLVGSDGEALRRALGRERERSPASVALSARASGDRLELSVAVDGPTAVAAGEAAEVWVAVTEAGLSTEVRRGENAGRTLRHAPVVRRLLRLGQLPSSGPLTTSVELPAGWRRERLKAVAFVQERKGRQVLGVAAAPLVP
jgi:hypothetical protein